MILYAVILFAVTIAFAVLAVMISRGRTDLINCYHEDRVKDKPMYCRKFGQSLWIIAAVMAASGIVSLFGESDAVACSAVGVLIVGMAVGTFRLFYVQKKYGGGVF
jgi:hypothetical protein